MTVSQILIIGPAWIGDMIMAQGLFRLLRQIQPDSYIDVIAPDWTRPLLERMPEVNKAFSLPFKHGDAALKQRWQLGRRLSAQCYQQAIVLPNSWKSAIIPFAAKIPLRTGWRGEMRWGLLNDVRYLDKRRFPSMLQRFAALALPAQLTLPDALPTPQLMVNHQARHTAMEKYALHTQKKIIALCPGAEFGLSKRWPAEYYAEIANQQLADNRQIWLFGSAKDKEISQQIQALTQHRCTDLAGKTSLAEAIDLLSLAALVITNDSGLMHIAAALDREIIALYGSTDPGFTPPLSTKAKILSLDLACRPCFQRNCPLKHHRCMRDLLPRKVLEAIAQCAF